MWTSNSLGGEDMSRTILVAALVSVIVLAGCTGQQSSGAMSADAETSGSQAPVSCGQVQGETHTVTYSQGGFSPQQLTIQRCDTVRWESQGPDMWVASDVHPTHTQYDGTSVNEHCPNGGDVFDQCSSGQSYSFTFQKTGEWGYHNHVRAAHTGTVVVTSR